MTTNVTDAHRQAWSEAPDIRFTVPPVCTVFWTVDDWCHCVDWTLPANATALARYQEGSC